jgi:hypothetical protein
MAQYKVIQDIEAEDKLVGPLTLKQFIYAGIAALCVYICFLGLTKHFPFILVIFLPVALLSGFFAFPWGRDQPTETWALAKIRFFFKPRLRIWDQSGIKDLVSITAPKQVTVDYTNGLTQNEVNSRLKALADTIDSRGWAIKNVNVNLYSEPSQLETETASDRLIDPVSLPQQVPTINITAADDIMEASEQAHRKQVIDGLQLDNQKVTAAVTPPNNYWFMNQPSGPTRSTASGYATFQDSPVIAPGSSDESLAIQSAEPTAQENALARKIEAASHNPNPAYAHMHTIQPLSDQPVAHALPEPQVAVTQTPDPAILGLANNNDRSVDSLAREANKPRPQEPSHDEVVVALR